MVMEMPTRRVARKEVRRGAKVVRVARERRSKWDEVFHRHFASPGGYF